jgi:hypothetical protein
MTPGVNVPFRNHFARAFLVGIIFVYDSVPDA